jgi:hypothetical protein
MERSVSVNAPSATADTSLVNGFPPGPTTAHAAEKADLGPCLYLGPEGQRCNERAFDSGFCARHQPGATAPITPASKVVIASMGIIGLLWPYFADLFREIVRLIHSQ